jgi:ankyrin repeat protein
MTPLSKIGIFAQDGRWDEVRSVLCSELTSSSELEKAVLLCQLSYYEHLDLCAFLLRAGADVNYRRLEDDCPHVSFFLEPRTTPLGQTILGHSYRRRKTIPILELLLHHGADPNLTTAFGYTPLQLAIVENCPEHARVLLNHSADPYKLNEDRIELAENAFELAHARRDERPWATPMLQNRG